jgi:hypothetical protein
MKTTLPLFLAALALSTAALVSAEPLPMAVFDFQTGERSLEKKGAEVGILLNAHLSTLPDVFLVERQEIDKLLGEQELGMAGNIAPDTAAKVGALIGAKVLVTGRVFESGGKGYLVAKVIGAETGRVFGELVTTSSLDKLDGPAAELAGKITATVAKQAGALTARVESHEARVERLKKAVSGKTLPAVVIMITEQHLGRPVIDPAAQTELMLLLREIGFEVVTPEAAASRADVVAITGEAFSEFGLRRGNLVSCRSRIEISVKASGKIIAVDRQRDVAVDIAEHSAGKRALENGALKLADRLVPQLANR